jgi:hypothetical protein
MSRYHPAFPLWQNGNSYRTISLNAGNPTPTNAVRNRPLADVARLFFEECYADLL